MNKLHSFFRSPNVIHSMTHVCVYVCMGYVKKSNASPCFDMCPYICFVLVSGKGNASLCLEWEFGQGSAMDCCKSYKPRGRAAPYQTGSLQWQPQATEAAMASNDSGNGSGLQQSKQHWALPAVMRSQPRTSTSIQEDQWCIESCWRIYQVHLKRPHGPAHDKSNLRDHRRKGRNHCATQPVEEGCKAKESWAP